jgi:hypothetical protein
MVPNCPTYNLARSAGKSARLILLDPKLKTLCLAAGDRNFVFRTSDELKVRAQLLKLGYVVPAAK